MKRTGYSSSICRPESRIQARKMAIPFPDSQETLVLGEATLTDSDVEVESKEMVPAAKKPKIGFVDRPPTVVTDSEDEDDLIELRTSDSVVAPPKVKPLTLEDQASQVWRSVLWRRGAVEAPWNAFGFTTQQIELFDWWPVS